MSSTEGDYARLDTEIRLTPVTQEQIDKARAFAIRKNAADLLDAIGIGDTPTVFTRPDPEEAA